VANVNGWAIYFHPAFKAKFDALVAEAETLRATLKPDEFVQHPKAKLLERLRSIVFVEVPNEPGSPAYAQGNTLGPSYRHWRRVKFLGRFRLFFRFSSTHRIIIYAWVNDEATLRKAGAKTDPYHIFENRIKAGNPPDDWDELVSESHSYGS
jgi:toxin YhaV